MAGLSKSDFKNPVITAWNDAFASGQLRNDARTVGHPGDSTSPTTSPPMTTTAATVATARSRRDRSRRSPRRSTSRALGTQSSTGVLTSGRGRSRCR